MTRGLAVTHGPAVWLGVGRFGMLPWLVDPPRFGFDSGLSRWSAAVLNALVNVGTLRFAGAGGGVESIREGEVNGNQEAKPAPAHTPSPQPPDHERHRR
jgi:hypothetical protein